MKGARNQDDVKLCFAASPAPGLAGQRSGNAGNEDALLNVFDQIEFAGSLAQLLDAALKGEQPLFFLHLCAHERRPLVCAAMASANLKM